MYSRLSAVGEKDFPVSFAKYDGKNLCEFFPRTASGRPVRVVYRKAESERKRKKGRKKRKRNGEQVREEDGDTYIGTKFASARPAYPPPGRGPDICFVLLSLPLLSRSQLFVRPFPNSDPNNTTSKEPCPVTLLWLTNCRRPREENR